MKASLLVLSLAGFLAIPSFAAPPPPDKAADKLSTQISPPEKPAEAPEEDAGDYTVFNGQKVPPLRELTGTDFDETVKEGYWFVKHYSPYCGHCQLIAPTWQTLYEYYYTSNPIPSSATKDGDTHPLNSFHGFYNFHFASLNCVAYGSKCEEHEVKAWPTFLLYKDGKMVEKFVGRKGMEELGHFVEERLESIRPGSRPATGVKFPEPGATEIDTAAKPDNPMSKDKDPAAGAAAGEKHKGKEDQQVTTPSEKSTNEVAKASFNEEPQKPKYKPNPLGTSKALTAEDFQSLVTTTQDPWFIKFYAPWCHHCQALAPVWSQMATEMEGKLNVGEVNCDLEVRLCKDARVKAYPTMYYFRGGERVEYDGLRGLGDLVTYANKALDVGSGVKDVDAEAFKQMEETEEVIFIYFYDHATTSEDFDALERLTLSLIGHAVIVKTKSMELAEKYKISTWPRLIVSRDGRASYFTGLAPKDMRDFRKVLNWMQSVWLPIVPELTASNAREIMDGRYVVLGILSRENKEDFILSKKELKNAALEWMDKQTQAFQLERQEMRDAKQLRIEEAEDHNDQRALRSAKSIRITISEDDKKPVGFAWVDSVFWERWIRTTYGIDTKRDGERVIINDEDNRRYWDITPAGGYIVPSRTSILETIPKVISSPPKLTPKSTVGSFEYVFFHINNFRVNHPFIALILLIVLLVTGATWIRRRIRRSNIGGGDNRGFFHLDGRESILSGNAEKAD